jgi:hypothetical protein
MENYVINFIINDNRKFVDLVRLFETAFSNNLTVKNDKGRLIATFTNDEFTVSFIDKYDDLSDELCDENYILELNFTSYQPDILIDKIKSILLSSNISFLKGICFNLENSDKSFFEFY